MEFPVDWAAWIYGKWFQNHPFLGGTIVVVACMLLVGVIVTFIWIRGVDKFETEMGRSDRPSTTPLRHQIEPPASKKDEPLTESPVHGKTAASVKKAPVKKQTAFRDNPVQTGTRATIGLVGSDENSFYGYNSIDVNQQDSHGNRFFSGSPVSARPRSPELIRLSNPELRAKVTNVVNSLRKLCRENEDEMTNNTRTLDASDGKNKEERESAVLGYHRAQRATQLALSNNYAENYKTTALSLRDEMVIRLNLPANDSKTFEYLWQNQTFITIREIADDLEMLSRGLQ